MAGMTIAALVVTCLGTVLLLLAYASPNWVESFGESNNPFVKAGIWEFCFNDYTFPKDFYARRWMGCWYIFSSDVRDMWEYLSPPWFIAVEVMMSIVCLSQLGCFLILLIVILKCTPFHHSHSLLNLATVAILVSAFLSLLSLAVFGHFKESRHWMYRPDQNVLSWSFGCAVVAMILQIVQGLIFFKFGQEMRAEAIKNPPQVPARSYGYEMSTVKKSGRF